MCGIDFAIGVTDKEVSMADKYVHFNEVIHAYLVNQEKDNGDDLKLLLNLDLYRQTVIFTEMIPQLKIICKALINKYNSSNHNEMEIRTFAQELKILCEDAIKQNKHIYAIGD